MVLIIGVWLAWQSVFFWSDLIVFAILYTLTALGITVGFHRLLHAPQLRDDRPAARDVRDPRLGGDRGARSSRWVADHRKHHAFSDQPGDPHSPHVDHGQRLARRAARPAARARRLALHPHPARRQGALRARPDRRPGDQADRPHCSSSGRVGGLLAAFWLGLLIGGTWTAALTGLLWGGVVRMLVLHHVTYSINSLCHFFGRQRFDTDDQSRNLAWLAIPSLGEAWHNNHHAFPTSAAHGLRRRQVDVSALVIDGAGEDRPRVGRRARQRRAAGEEARRIAPPACSRISWRLARRVNRGRTQHWPRPPATPCIHDLSLKRVVLDFRVTALPG